MNNLIEAISMLSEHISFELRYGSNLLNFYFFILFLIKEGKVERFVSSVDVAIDELHIPGNIDKKVRVLFVMVCLW